MRVAVFCGSAFGRHEVYRGAAQALGRELATRGVGLVYGGASVGLMGVVADAALTAGGEVHGVIPRHLVEREVAHHGLTELHVVENMHQRKARMAELADAFVALPGGVGTLEELFEVWTWGVLGLHTKPVGLLDVDGFYGRLLDFVDHAHGEGFLAERYRRMLLVDTAPGRLLEAFAGYRPPVEKFAGQAELAEAETRTVRTEHVDALGWVCVRDRRLLTVRARDNDALYLPGGKREPGESDVAALSREVAEEIGVSLLPASFSLSGLYTAPAHGYPAGTLVRLAAYSARHEGDPEPAAEVTELAWVTTAERDRVAPAVGLVLDDLHASGAVD